MANSVTYFAAGSNFTVKRGQGYLYGLTVTPTGAGGSIIVADLAEAGAAGFNHAQASTVARPMIVAGPFINTGPDVVNVFTHGRHFEQGLSLSVTSTATVAVFYE